MILIHKSKVQDITRTIIDRAKQKKETHHNLWKQSKAMIFLFSKPCKFKRNKFGWSVV